MSRWEPGGRRRRFSRREISHLVASMAALTLAFHFFLSEDVTRFIADPGSVPVSVLLSPATAALAVTVVVTGFLFHELAHKFVAQLYGHWSEFRASMGHLGLAVVISLFGFLFAAPGAVNIVGDVTERENGVISAVGPLMNVVMAALFVLLWRSAFGTALGEAFRQAAFFNAVLAGFNMIPVSPLDGSKVAKWNVGIYVLLLVIIAFQFVLIEPALSVPGGL